MMAKFRSRKCSSPVSFRLQILIHSRSSCKTFRFSKQNFLSEVTNPYTLPDHTPSFKEYTGSKNNRFLSLTQASKNRIQPPSKVSC